MILNAPSKFSRFIWKTQYDCIPLLCFTPTFIIYGTPIISKNLFQKKQSTSWISCYVLLAIILYSRPWPWKDTNHGSLVYPSHWGMASQTTSNKVIIHNGLWTSIIYYYNYNRLLYWIIPWKKVEYLIMFTKQKI